MAKWCLFLRHCLTTDMLTTDIAGTLEHLTAPAYCLLHYSLTPRALAAFGFQGSCSTQIPSVLRHGAVNRGRQWSWQNFKASTWTCTRPNQLVILNPGLVLCSWPRDKHFIHRGFTGTTWCPEIKIPTSFSFTQSCNRIQTWSHQEVGKFSC